jgi:hypothetical protein
LPEPEGAEMINSIPAMLTKQCKPLGRKAYSPFFLTLRAT